MAVIVTTGTPAWRFQLEATEPTSPYAPNAAQNYSCVFGDFHDAARRVANHVKCTWYGGDTFADLLSLKYDNVIHVEGITHFFIRIYNRDSETLDLFAVTAAKISPEGR